MLIARSKAGARGPDAAHAGTAQQLGVDDSFAPDQNVRGGTAYLDSLLVRYRDNIALALAAYNAGPQAVDHYHGIPPYHETRVYVARVIHEFNRRVAARRTAVVSQTLRPQHRRRVSRQIRSWPTTKEQGASEERKIDCQPDHPGCSDWAGVVGLLSCAFSFATFKAQLAMANWPMMAVGLGCIYLAYIFRAVRWALLIRPNKRVGLFSLTGTQVIGFSSVALVGRVADLTRPYLVAKKTGLPLSTQIAVYIVERPLRCRIDGVNFLFGYSARACRLITASRAFQKVGYYGLAGTLAGALFSSWCGFPGVWWPASLRRPLAHSQRRLERRSETRFAASAPVYTRCGPLVTCSLPWAFHSPCGA